MSLVKLLSAGKSLVGVQDSPSRYRMDKQLRLPKFVSARNPFLSEAAKESVSADSETTGRPDTATVRTAAKEPKRTSLVLRLASATRRSAAWLGRANPFSRFAESARSKKSTIPCFARPPIQSELCLDKVQVVRNDLSDADLEVVPVAPAGPKSNLEVSEQCETSERAWAS